MIQHGRAVVLLALALAPGLIPGGLAGQRADEASLGFTVGLGWLPRARNSYCGHPVDQAVHGIVTEGRLALPLGHRFSLEGRLAAQSKVDLQDCGGSLLAAADSFYITDEYYRGSQSFAGGDVRLRYDVPSLPLVLTVGSGRLWRLKAPYYVFGPGLRLGQSVRLILDGDFVYADVPFDEVWRRWSGGAPADLYVRVPLHEWRTLVSGRLGVELRLR